MNLKSRFWKILKTQRDTLKDKVFDKPIKEQFSFNEEVANVFDDMLGRSVPYYHDVLKLVTGFSQNFLKDDSIVYDIGCSTGSTLIELIKKSPYKLQAYGIDTSSHMLDKARVKAHAFGVENIEFICDDVFNIEMNNADLIISNYTLQFIRPLLREKLIKKIYDSLCDGQIFIFSEKVISEDKMLNKIYIDEYYNFKKTMGYSEYEISQKREALENVLIPYSMEENIKMVKEAGFKSCDILFKWYNFATFVAKK
jgi:tRNA (cmo5U34)-methyltransferase